MGTVPTLPFWELAWKPLQPVADDGHLDAKMGVRKRRADRGAEEEKGVRVRGAQAEQRPREEEGLAGGAGRRRRSRRTSRRQRKTLAQKEREQESG